MRTYTPFFLGIVAFISMVCVIGIIFLALKIYDTYSTESQVTVGSLPPKNDTSKSLTQNYTNQQLFLEYLSSIDQNEALSGTLFFTSSPAVKTLPVTFWDSYAVSVDTKKIESIEPQNPPYFLFQHNNSLDQIYTSKPKAADPGGHAANSGLYFDNGTSTEVATVEDTSPSSKTYSRIRIPRISGDGSKYVYNAQTWTGNAEGPTIRDLDSWNINAGSVDTIASKKAEFFVQGFQGSWIGTSDYIVYLKSDGLYIKEYMPNSTEMRILPNLHGAAFQANNLLATTPIGNYMVLTSPKSTSERDAFIEIYKINLTEQIPSAEVIKRIILPINTPPFWPLFSPDGRYLSFQTNSSIRPKLQFYDLVQDRFVEENIIDIGDYDFMTSFTTGWVKTFKP